MERRYAVAAVAVIIVVATAAYLSRITETGVETRITTNATGTTLPANVHVAKPVYGNASLMVPAVDESGEGVVTRLKVESAAGEGRTLVNINQLLFWTDTQFSIQTAKYVAENYTGYDLSDADIIYTINSTATLIEGPSAGAALAVTTVAALRNATLKPGVMITGTIEPNGTIGQVGGIVEKARAAKAAGSTLFLVPEGQSVEQSYELKRTCRPMGPVTYCTTDYVQVAADASEQAGIQVREVSNIAEALKYFLG
jgi:uncharacterized protein